MGIFGKSRRERELETENRHLRHENDRLNKKYDDYRSTQNFNRHLRSENRHLREENERLELEADRYRAMDCSNRKTINELQNSCKEKDAYNDAMTSEALRCGSSEAGRQLRNKRRDLNKKKK